MSIVECLRGERLLTTVPEQDAPEVSYAFRVWGETSCYEVTRLVPIADHQVKIFGRATGFHETGEAAKEYICGLVLTGNVNEENLYRTVQKQYGISEQTISELLASVLQEVN